MGAAFGAAGQRCMALSVAVFVGESKQWLPDLVKMAGALKVNAGKSAACACSLSDDFVFILCSRWSVNAKGTLRAPTSAR